jgi:hypothetical protein
MRASSVATIERRHAPGEAPWEERWWFDFAAPDGSVGGYVRLALRPWEGVAWYWAAVVGAGRPLVALRAHDVRIPATGTEIRASGVWSALTCESPMEHWSVGLESFGASFTDPLRAWGDERGDVVPFGLDLEWESSRAALEIEEGYGQWCAVHGDVLIGDERVDIDGSGWRDHTWGPPAQGASARAAINGELYQLETEWEGGLPLGARGGSLDIEPVYLSPVLVPGAAVVHALCRAANATDGDWGWASWVTPYDGGRPNVPVPTTA